MEEARSRLCSEAQLRDTARNTPLRQPGDYRRTVPKRLMNIVKPGISARFVLVLLEAL